MANHCRVFTPTDYASELLDQLGYSNDLFGKKLLENSCGNGNILCVVVDRYILSCFKSNMSYEQIKKGLEEDLIGVEIDKDTVNNCRNRLDCVSLKYGISGVKWNLIVDDYLKHDMNLKFDYIVSNPPYITFRDIPLSERVFLRNTFESCKSGRFDYYYAFIEKSICSDLKAKQGRAAFIVPVGLYRNVFANSLRSIIKNRIIKIYDYSTINKFPGTTTSSTVVLLTGTDSATLEYNNVKNSEKRVLQKTDLGAKWIFNTTSENSKKYRFGDFYCVHSTIATLYNKAFILENFSKSGNYYISAKDENDKVEAMLVKKAYSMKNERRKEKKEICILFPYLIDNSRINQIDESSFSTDYPFAFNHLNMFRKQLDGRASDAKAKWYEYGRSQALSFVFQEKLALPVVFSNNASVSYLDENTIPIAGMIVTNKKESNHSLEEARRLLTGEQFAKYLSDIGVTTVGKSKRVTAKDIEDFTFSSWQN